MNNWLTLFTNKNPAAGLLLRHTARSTIVISVAVWLAYVFWRLPAMLAQPAYYHEYIPTPLTILPAALFFSLGLATLINLLIHNRRRLRAVLRPSLGRILGAIIMGLLTPLVVMNWTPWIVIGLAVVMSSAFDWALPLSLLPAVAWYLPSCLIVSGIKSKPTRIAIYALFWWASYCGHILINGVPNFTI